MTYQWYFRVEAIPHATNNVFRVDNVSVANLGSYRVKVSDSAGSVDSNPATLSLNITVAPPFVPDLSIAAESNGLALSWRGPGIVEMADSPEGPWVNVGGTRIDSFLSNNASAAAHYRLRNPHPRNAQVFIPSSYRPGTKLPVIFSVHRFHGDAAGMESYVPLRVLAELEGFLCVLADGVMNSSGNRFWNAVDGCCDFSNQEINDVAFFRELIELLLAEHDADPARIHFFGHSNGGCMAYRMAQEHSELIASVASLAGAMDRESSMPAPVHPVSVLQIHGTQDPIIPYHGGVSGIPGQPSPPIPMTGALESVQRWADWNGCPALEEDPSPSMDLDSNVAGLDTVVTRTTNCPSGVTAELWTIIGANHFPAFTPGFAQELVTWLLNHPKPVASRTPEPEPSKRLWLTGSRTRR
jgi:polyhydroxybutyrate depolymerase